MTYASFMSFIIDVKNMMEHYIYYICVNCENAMLIINYVNHVINYISVHIRCFIRKNLNIY